MKQILELETATDHINNETVQTFVGDIKREIEVRVLSNHNPVDLSTWTLEMRATAPNGAIIATGEGIERTDDANGRLTIKLPAVITSLSGVIRDMRIRMTQKDTSSLLSTEQFVISVLPTPGFEEKFPQAVDAIQQAIDALIDATNAAIAGEAKIDAFDADAMAALQKAQEGLDAANKLVADAADLANAAATNADTAANAAIAAAGAANTAKSDADTATTAANTAADKATASATAADTATGNADTATGAANAASDKAIASANTADDASAKANEATTNADAATQKALESATKADDAATNANAAASSVDAAINEAKQFVEDAPSNPDFKGPKGDAATVKIGKVTKGDAASITNSGTSTDAVIDVVLPKGDTGPQGPAGSIANGEFWQFNILDGTSGEIDTNLTVNAIDMTETFKLESLGLKTGDMIVSSILVNALAGSGGARPDMVFDSGWGKDTSWHLSPDGATGLGWYKATVPAGATTLKLQALRPNVNSVSIKVGGLMLLKGSQVPTNWVPSINDLKTLGGNELDEKLEDAKNSAMASANKYTDGKVTGLAKTADLNPEYGKVPALTGTTDLNTMTTPGTYLLKGTIVNGPATNWGRLEVRQADYIGQWYWAGSPNLVYYRTGFNGTWTKWQQIVTVDQVMAIIAAQPAKNEPWYGSLSEYQALGAYDQDKDYYILADFEVLL